jgi:L-lactate dehydrogenase (cytochrome)
MMGQIADLPFFICPTGMAGLAHPLGERAVARAAGNANVIYMVCPLLSSCADNKVSTNASTPLAEIVSNATRPDQKFFMQLYVDRNRPKTEKLLEQINGLGMKAIFVTVDAAAPGKREADERSRAEIEVVSITIPVRPELRLQASGVSGGKIAQDSKGGGIGRSVGGFIDPKLNWEDLKWLRRHTDLPIGLKGVQSVEDCIKAAELGVDAIYLSNHGLVYHITSNLQLTRLVVVLSIPLLHLCIPYSNYVG